MTRQLVAECSRCAALCCVALPFRRSADFAFDKAAGTPCRHLDATACGIHPHLAERGFRGCLAYDCFGAGQHVVQHTFGGAHHEPRMFATFGIVRALHEMLWYLDEVRGESVDAAELFEEVARLADGDAEALAALDLGAVRGRVGSLLADISVRLRAPDAPDHRHADLAGRDLRRTSLRDADLRGAVLIAADLRGVDLGRADLLGADLRDARLGAAHLRDTLFLTRPQLASAALDDRTTVTPRLR